MKDTTETYNASRINMRKGYEIPHDTFIMDAVIEASEDEMAMAMFLVLGDPPASLEPVDIADVSVLCSVLPFLKEHGIREIHRIVDMPIAMFQRWNQSMDNAIKRGLVDEDVGISKNDFEGMMNG